MMGEVGLGGWGAARGKRNGPKRDVLAVRPVRYFADLEARDAGVKGDYAPTQVAPSARWVRLGWV